jgi:hypothetical protein
MKAFTRAVFAISIAILSTPQATRADGVLDSEQALHATAHIGASYLITHAGSSTCNLITQNRHKTLCLLSGVVMAASAGTMKEVVLDKGETNNRHMLGYAENATGIGAAVTFLSFVW